MGKGGYLGGSTVVSVYPKASGKNRTRGLLALEVEFAEKGKVRRESLHRETPQKSRKAKKALVSAQPAAKAPASAPPSTKKRPANSAPVSATVFSREAIQTYVRQHHPNCKGAALKRVAKLGVQGRWTGMELGEVVASCMEQHLLYEVFSLPGLVACGYTQERALKMLSPLVSNVLSDWGAKPVWLARGKA